MIVAYGTAFGYWCRQRAEAEDRAPRVIVGRDGRITGEVCARLVTGALQSSGCDVIDAGMATTPTVEMAVLREEAAGGIVLSASHNPEQWNALKLLNEKGEFLTPDQSEEVFSLIEDDINNHLARFDALGDFREKDYLDYHIQQILDLPFIDAQVTGRKNFSVVVDGINSVGGSAIPVLLRALGLEDADIHCVNCEPTGRFAHEPEPLPENLRDTMAVVKERGADLGIVVDPDVDRLAFVEDGGRFFGEELTQVIAADFLWHHESGPFVTNLSSSRAIEDIAGRHGEEVFRSSVGEINVVTRMKEVDAVLGGEGNGGVILPELHYGRDALVGTAMVLQYLAEEDIALSDLRARYPTYVISKNKLSLDAIDADRVLTAMAERYKNERISTIDGVKIDFDDGWVHLRKSNTEPIIRIYAEAGSKSEADAMAERFIGEMKEVG
jgi:phosphomannomutase